MNIGEKIKKLRLEKMMTQAELSGERVTRNMLSLIEKGKAVPSLQTLDYIASRLNVSVAFLLANEREEKMLVKYSKISDIRLAFKNKSYRLCVDMCKRLGRNSESRDEEIKLITAESSLEIAKEEIYNGRVRFAWTALDDAVLFASETMYNTKHIEAQAWILFDYLGQLSPSLVSENMDFDAFDFNSAKALCLSDAFCAYIVALNDLSNQYSVHDEMYALHIEARKSIEKKEFEKAYNLLNDILKLDVRLPAVLLYSVFSDLEDCCKQLGNPLRAREYSDEKVTQLERILS